MSDLGGEAEAVLRALIRRKVTRSGPSAVSGRRLPSANLTAGEFLHVMMSCGALANFATTAQSAAPMGTMCWTGSAFDEAPGVSERFAICVRLRADLDQRCVVAFRLIGLAQRLGRLTRSIETVQAVRRPVQR